MKNIRRRIERLEDGFIHDPVILIMPDGSIRKISGGGKHLLTLYTAMMSNEFTPAEEKEIELIDQCVRAIEPGGGHMIELCKCLLRGPGGEVPPEWTPHPN